MATYNLGLVKAIHTGVNPPQYNILIWFDERVGKHKVFNRQTNQWEILGDNGAQLSEIEVVYNDLSKPEWNSKTLEELITNQENFEVKSNQIHFFIERNIGQYDKELENKVWLFISQPDEYGQGNTAFTAADFAYIAEKQSSKSIFLNTYGDTYNNIFYSLSKVSTLEEWIKAYDKNIIDQILANAFSVSWSDKKTDVDYVRPDGADRTKYTKQFSDNTGLIKLLRIGIDLSALFQVADKIEVVVDRYRHAEWKGKDSKTKRAAGYREIKDGNLNERVTKFEVIDKFTWIDINAEKWFKSSGSYPSPKGISNGSSYGTFLIKNTQERVGFIDLAFKVRIYKNEQVYTSKYLDYVRMLAYQSPFKAIRYKRI